MNILILSCSRNPVSNSSVLAHEAHAFLCMQNNVDVELIDARLIELPDFDHDDCYRSDAVQELTQKLAHADSIVIATPVYNWSTSGFAKKIMENTGTDDTGRLVRAWEDKVITFLCAAGISQSYLAYLPLANSLMLDYKCILNPHIVFAIGEDFQDRQIVNASIKMRLERVMRIAVELTELLQKRTILSTWEI